jgi:hypothetical protein
MVFYRELGAYDMNEGKMSSTCNLKSGHSITRTYGIVFAKNSSPFMHVNDSVPTFR